MDGWTTAQGIPVLGVAVQNHLVDAMETVGEAHTTEFLLSMAEKSLHNVETEMKVSVVALVTDTASNMAAMRAALAAKHPQGVTHKFFILILSSSFCTTVLQYGCQCHILNLAAQDLVRDKGRAQVLDQVITVLKAFRNVHSLAAGLRTLKLPRPPLPASTRWTSHRNCLAYYNHHWAFLAQVPFLTLCPFLFPLPHAGGG